MSKAKALGRKIHAQREALGIGLNALARKAKVDAGWLSRTEHGYSKEIGIFAVSRVAKALGTTTSKLLGEKGGAH